MNRNITMFHHTRIFINLRAYRQNLQTILSRLDPGISICSVLKADAYGHGLHLLAPEAIAAGARQIAIVDNWEVETIRQLGITCPLIRLRPSIPDEVIETLPWNVDETIGSFDQAIVLSQLGERCSHPIPVHIALDVGMGRMGFTFSLQESQIQQVCSLPGLRIRGVMTHFPCADEKDFSLTQAQKQQFLRQYDSLKPYLPRDAQFHYANSAIILRLPSFQSRFVRAGIITYGLAPSDAVPFDASFQPVMSVVTKIVQVREMPEGSTVGYGMTYRLLRPSRIATLPIGYANGYLRKFANQAFVLVHGVRCPVIGRVSMDMVTIDVTHVDGVEPGDDVVLLGSQGQEHISADDLARIAGTINYEICCQLGIMNRECRKIL